MVTGLRIGAVAIGSAIQGIFAQDLNFSRVDFPARWWSGSTPCASWESKDKVVRAIKRGLADAEAEISFTYITHTFKEKIRMSETPGETA